MMDETQGNFIRQHGEWINHRNDYGHNIADCSICGKAMQWHDEDEDGIPRYCWFCGADMREEANDERVILTHNKELKSIKSEDYRRAFTAAVCGDCKYVNVPRNRKPCCSCSWLERESYYEEAKG